MLWNSRQGLSESQVVWFSFLLIHSFIHSPFFFQFVLLVPNEMLLSIINKLLHHPVKALRRKALDLANTFLQQEQQEFADEEKNCLLNLLEPLVEIINSIGTEIEQQDLMLQQTALLTLKLLAKVLCSDHAEKFKKVSFPFFCFFGS